MPDAFELPWMLGAVVPLMRGERLAGFTGGIVSEAVAFDGRPLRCCVFRLDARLKPGLASVFGCLQNLAEPAACLRGVNPIRIHRLTLHVINLPAREVRAGNLPVFPFSVRGKNECAFARSNQDTNVAHAGRAP